MKQALRSAAGVTIDSPSVGLEERFRVLLEHSRHFEKHSMIRSFVGMRKHLAWYCYDSPGAAELRAQMVRVSHIEELVQCLRAYAETLGLRIGVRRAPRSSSTIHESQTRLLGFHETHPGLHLAPPP